MKTNTAKTACYVALLLVASGAAGAALRLGGRAPGSNDPPAGAPPPALLAEALTVEARYVRPENALSGQVEPYRVATVAAEVAGRIAARPIERGDRLGRGQTLALLDADAARAALDQARAAHRQTVAARRQAEAEYDRVVIETGAARQQAGAQFASARAGEQKVRAFTRTQELRQAEAGLAQARTDERLARIEADRYESLVREGAVAQQPLDRARAALDAAVARRQAAEQAVSLAREGARREDIEQAGAQVETARAGLRIARDARPARLAALRRQIDALWAGEAQAAAAAREAGIALGKHRIVSPLSGRVLATLAEAGEMAAPGTPVARVAEIGRVKVAFAVPESSRAALKLGQRVTVRADAVPGAVFAGRITVLGVEADARARTFPVEVTVANADERLLPNMVARLRLPVGPAAARALVPIDAVATDGGAAYVFVLAGGRAARRDVVLGAPAGRFVEIARGLAPGERIAATPQRLTDGARVRVARR